jgi:hypothetical protein
MTANPVPRPTDSELIVQFLKGKGATRIHYVLLLLAAGSLLCEPFHHMRGIFYLVFASPCYTFFVASARDINAAWVRAVVQRDKVNLSRLRAIYSSLVHDRLMMQMLVTLGGALAASYVEQLVLEVYRSGGLAATLLSIFFCSLLFPLSAVPGLMLSRALKTVRRVKESNLRLIPRVVRSFKIDLRRFLTSTYPYISAYFGFVFFCLMCAFHPSSIGTGFAGWLRACAVDANIVNDSHYYLFDLGASACTAFALFAALRPLAVRLCATFQMLANRLVVNRDNLFDAIVETATVKASRITLPEAHPHLNNIWSLCVWLVFCYAVLFILAGACPGDLGCAINNWLSASLYSVFHINLEQHSNVQLFIASVIAAWGCVPLAVMSCSFLPPKKPKSLVVSPQGVLCPDSISTAVGQSPMKLWTDLTRVSVACSEKPEKQVLRLTFNSGGTIKLKTSEYQPELVAELLSSADEYSNRCKFEPAAVDYRAKLSEESKRAATVTDVHKFSSSIFSPRKGGERLKNGDYRVVRKLAGKPLSAVYLARDRNENHVVIKEFVLPTCVEQCERLDETFDREYKILRSLNHACIAKVLETFEEKGAKYIVIEHIRGQDLRSLVQRRGRRSEKSVLRWAVQIAGLMRYLHEQDPAILHRDLTPDNLMEDEDGNVVLIDFGAAHQFLEGVTGTLIGKQCYIAPEQLRGKPCIQSDIYSFGCTLQFLLTGSDPAALQQSDPEARSVTTSESLRQMILKCTEFEPADRYDSFAQIIRELEGTKDDRA